MNTVVLLAHSYGNLTHMHIQKLFHALTLKTLPRVQKVNILLSCANELASFSFCLDGSEYHEGGERY